MIAYMMKEYQMPLADAKKHVKSIRGCINPNDGFMSQLHSYEGILTARFVSVSPTQAWQGHIYIFNDAPMNTYAA